jgi:uncharacterized protein YceK
MTPKPGEVYRVDLSYMHFRHTVLLLLIWITTGCASIGSRQRGNVVRPFAGVRDNARYLAHPSEADQPGLQFMNIVDMPFSAIADTIMLPFDSRETKSTD